MGLAQPLSALALTLEEERKLGKEAYDEIMAQAPLVRDPDCLDYIREIKDRLAKGAPEAYPFGFEVNIIDEGELNAFALPGGYIFFFRGMVTSMDNEGELAGVLAHEMGHVWRRHISKRFAKAGPVSALSLAGVLAGVLLGAVAGAPELGQALTLGSMAGGQQAMLAFSRSDEEEADWAAFNTLRNAGYPPQEMLISFRRIWRMERNLGSDQVPTYLRTHPTGPQRMERIENMLRRNPTPLGGYDNDEFLRIKARLVALYEPVQQARVEFARALQNDPDDAHALSGQALLLMRQDKYNDALAYWDRLQKLRPNDPYILRDKGECLMRLGRFEPAQELLGKALLKRPRDRATLMDLGMAYLHQGYLEPAQHTFKRVLALEPDSPQAQHALGVALGKQGQHGLAAYHLGLSFKLEGDMKTARYHLERALLSDELSPDQREAAQKALDQIKSHPGEGGPPGPPQDKGESFDWAVRTHTLHGLEPF